jgi:UTP--glucose-1-phosphate uridylyltransferase
MSLSAAPVRKAVIPVAGLGTRFLPVTRSVPKALLPIVSTPIIHYAVRDAVQSGINEIILVISPGMESVGDYFAPKPVLEQALRSKGNKPVLDQQLEIASMAKVSCVYQHEPRGLGHAVLMARDIVGTEPFAVYLPDELLWSSRPVARQLLDARAMHGGSAIAVIEVAEHEVETKGIVDGVKVEDGVYSIRGVVEKPKREKAPSRMAIVGPYILEPGVMRHLAKERVGAGGEIQLTDGIEATIGQTPLHAVVIDGYRADAGIPAGMLAAQLYEAQFDPTLRQVVLDAVARWGS